MAKRKATARKEGRTQDEKDRHPSRVQSGTPRRRPHRGQAQRPIPPSRPPRFRVRATRVGGQVGAAGQAQEDSR